jgi:hypothetical protein
MFRPLSRSYRTEEHQSCNAQTTFFPLEKSSCNVAKYNEENNIDHTETDPIRAQKKERLRPVLVHRLGLWFPLINCQTDMGHSYDFAGLALHDLGVGRFAIRQYCPLAAIVRLVMSRLPCVERDAIVLWQHIAVYVRPPSCSHDTVRHEPVEHVLEKATEWR